MRQPLHHRLHRLERTVAPHSLSLEHRAECVPLFRALLDESLEPIDDSLHQGLFRFAAADWKRRIEVDVVMAWRDGGLTCRHQRSTGVERDDGRPPRHDAAAAEGAKVQTRSLPGGPQGRY